MSVLPGPTEQESLPAPEYAGEGGLPTVARPLWTVRRKAALVQAIRSGRINLAEACARYSLQEKEIRAWEALMRRHGLPVAGTPRVGPAPEPCRKLRLVSLHDGP